jgi:hypothetical protein
MAYQKIRTQITIVEIAVINFITQQSIRRGVCFTVEYIYAATTRHCFTK